ncbi:UNVERIFIED_ORG: hypothetical protein J2W82_000856 [Pseudomonas mohnii]|nr:hypothetical protein [Pseudomonas mohnii]
MWNMGAINVADGPQLMSYRGFLTLLNVVSNSFRLALR